MWLLGILIEATSGLGISSTNDIVVVGRSFTIMEAVAEAAKSFQDTLERETKALEEKTKAFEHREKLFEEAYPDKGKESDVLYLNVGGTKAIAVFRRTLTLFEDSMLAAKFSGRWDDTLEKDREGNFFIDQDPDVFLQLISFLRMCASKKRNAGIPAPDTSSKLCWMLEYYELMPAVYPFRWDTKSGECTSIEASYNSFQFSATNETRVMLRQLYGLRVESFTVLVEHGNPASTKVGWAYRRTEWDVKHNRKSDQDFLIDVEQKNIHENGTELFQNLDVPNIHLEDMLLHSPTIGN